jgi:endo-1,4-beta-xylanase
MEKQTSFPRKGGYMKFLSKKPAAVFTASVILSGLGVMISPTVSYADSANGAAHDIPRLYEAFQNSSANPDAAEGFGYGGMAGVCIGPDALRDDKRMDLVKYHFDNITIENQFKQDSLLPSYKPNMDAPDGNGGYFPTLDFNAAKPILDWIKDYNASNTPADADIQVRGHVLVWHSQAREWFFKENYEAEGNYVSPEVMNTRLEYYIKTVFTYLEENAYADMFYGWDVVNEAISDGGDVYRKDGHWWSVYQDESYIVNAFTYANQYAPAHIKLFYNDYNDTTASKVRDIVTLIEAVKAKEGAPGEGTRIDGMGMQGHYDMRIPTANEFKTAAIAYQEALGEGGEIQVTELDMKATLGFAGGRDPEQMAEENIKQGLHYAEIYNAIRELVADKQANITNIVFWGTHDRISWLKFFNGVGGGGSGAEVYPLLFDDKYQAKPAYWAFVNQDRISPPETPMEATQTTEETAPNESENNEAVNGTNEAAVNTDDSLSLAAMSDKTTDASGKSNEADGRRLWAVLGIGVICAAAICVWNFYRKRKK